MLATLEKCGLSKADAATYLRVSERTIWRWCAEGPPAWVPRSLSWLTGEQEFWEGFQFRNDHVITPLGSSVSQAVIGNIEYYGYIQRMIGHRGDWLPGLPKNPYDVDLVDDRAAGLLADLLETFKNQN